MIKFDIWPTVPARWLDQSFGGEIGRLIISDNPDINLAEGKNLTGGEDRVRINSIGVDRIQVGIILSWADQLKKIGSA